jgi:hypothetical protein
MISAEKDLIVSRIIAGCFKCEVDNIILLLKHPTRFQRYLAEEVYQEQFEKALANGSYTEAKLMEFLYKKNLWSDKKQKDLNNMIKNIDDFKLGLFEAGFKSQQQNIIRKALTLTKAEQSKLHAQLHEYDYLTASGVANMAKARYIVATSLHRVDGSKLFNDSELWAVPDYIVEIAANSIAVQKLTEAKIREIARTDPWRTTWLSRKSEASVFGIAAVDLTDEQRMLSIWATVYDNVYEHPDCPEDSVISDDDILDGWMILQKRKREAERGGKTLDNMIDNENIRNSEEIFIPADTIDDARKVNTLNDAGAAIVKSQRQAVINRRGIVNETEMPDSQMKIRQQMTEMYMQQVKGTG